MEDRQPGHTALDHLMYLDAPHGWVYWDIRQRYVHCEWTEYFEGQALRDAYGAILQAITDHKATRALTDSRHRGLISVDDQRWLDQVWMPQMLESTITKLAVVRPDGAIGRMSMTNALKSVPDSKVAMVWMDSVPDALAWLLA